MNQRDSIIVELTGVADMQTIVVTLSNVTDNLGSFMPSTPVSMNLSIAQELKGVSIGDTSANKTVNSTDVRQTKAQFG
jgi:hypothetical protein